MLIKHWNEIDLKDWRWENFSPKELACPCCGEAYFDEDALDKLQRTRDILGVPMKINSAHRCVAHNEEVDGAEHSQHLEIAFDISLRTKGMDPQALFKACKEGGFTTFGFYNSFLHTDTREPGRRWYSDGAAERWQGIADIEL